MSEEGNDAPCMVPKKYIATKVVEAVPMSLGMFHGMHPAQTFPGNPEDEGYCVIYPQVGEKTPYHGWCPKAQFEAMNQDPSKGMTFGHAIEMMKLGKHVARAGWRNHFGRYLWVLPGANVPAEWCKEPHLRGLAETNGGHVDCLPSIRMYNVLDRNVLTGWNPSQADMFATDWIVVGQSAATEKPDMGNMSDGYHTFNELYEHRMALFAAIVSAYPERSWKSRKHFDDEKDPMFDGYFVVGVETPAGEATYHYKLEVWDLFNCKEVPRAPKWDGHSNSDVVQRLLTLRTPA